MLTSCWQCCCRQVEARRASEDAETSAARAQTEMAALRKQIHALEQEVKEAKEQQAADISERMQVAQAAAAKR